MSKIKDNSSYHVVRLRCYPTTEQEETLAQWLEELRWLYNHSLHQRKSVWEEAKRTLHPREQRDALPLLKKERPSLKKVPAQATQDCLERLQGAFDHFFRRCKERKQGSTIKAGYPRFKKYGRYNSLTFTQVWLRQTKDLSKPEYYEVCRLYFDESYNPPKEGEKFPTVSATLTLPKLGELKVRVHRDLDWRRARRITVKRSSSGRWYACVCLADTAVSPPSHQGEAGGVDVGLKKLVTTSDGQSLDHPHFLQKSEAKLKKEQRKLSNKQVVVEEHEGKKQKRRSKGWEKQRKKVARCHEKIKNQRLDFLHKLSLWLVMSYSVVVFERLNIQGMVKNHHLAKSILDAGWGQLIIFATYKSVRLGSKVSQVDPRYTSQDCSRCGHRVPKTLAERLHKCTKCGLVMCRDQNAAKNILKKVGLGQSEPANGDDAIGERHGERRPLAVKSRT